MSNLPFLGKVIEKVVAQQLVKHLSNHGLDDKFQYAYKAGHSCETALLKVTNDVREALDQGEGVYLIMLDMSAAFVDHQILLTRLENEVGVIFVIFLSPRHGDRSNLVSSVIRIAGELIKPSSVVRNLGTVIDNSLAMNDCIMRTSRSIYWQLRHIGQIRRYLDNPTCAKLINSLVTSRLDYNNSLLYGLPASAVSRLQSVQNHAAPLLTRTGYRNHIVPVLRDLHWLPVTERIKYKILVILHKCLNCKKYPSYLSDLLKPYKPNRELRSSSDITLLVKPRSSSLEK